MLYKAIVSDLDGTLLNNNHEISEYTQKTICKLIEKGYKFFIATGRHHIDAANIKNRLKLNTMLITSNGARVHNETGEELFAYNIDQAIVHEILQLNVYDDIHINIYQADKWLTDKENSRIKLSSARSNFFYELIEFKTLEPQNVAKIFFSCPDEQKLVDLHKKIQDRFPDQLTLTFSNPHCLEVMKLNVSKGKALKHVLERYNISPKECIAFGDGLNDLEMLQFVGKGLVMGNAHNKLKEVLSEHEVIQENHKDGVAKYLEKLL